MAGVGRGRRVRIAEASVARRIERGLLAEIAGGAANLVAIGLVTLWNYKSNKEFSWRVTAKA